MSIRFGSVCSGIEAASVAWGPLGWQAAWLSEIAPFPNAVLAHHYPTVPNLGDMATVPARVAAGEVEAPDLLCGGTPCQAFSKAGSRGSLSDARGNLSLIFCELADAIDTARAAAGQEPCVVFWENVPGVLNTDDNAFGCFLAGLSGDTEPLVPPRGKWSDAGYVHGPERSIAWRVLDAQHFGLPQRRRRVYVVASARSTFDPAKILFEFGGPRGDSPKAAGQGQKAVACETNAESGSSAGHWWNGDNIATTLDAVLYKKQALPENNRFPAVYVPAWVDAPALDDKLCNVHLGELVSACACPDADKWAAYGLQPLDPCVLRFITPIEGERLQGFPDNHTRVPYKGKPADQCPDSPRYMAIGNSWPVPVVRWIGQRIAERGGL